MNGLVQLGIGVLAAGLIMCALFSIKKMRRLIRYIYAGLVTAAGIALLVCGLMAKEPVAEAVASPLTKEEQVEFAYAFAEQGEYDIAEELMAEYSDMYGYDDACSLFTARMELLQGNYAVAGGIYARLQADDAYAEQIAEEYALIQKKDGVDLSAAATIRYLKQQGLNPADYGYSETEVQATEEGLQITDEQITAAVFAGISEEYKTKGFEKTVSAVTEATRLYDMFLDGSYGTPDEEMAAQIKSVRKALDKKMDEGEGQCACVRNALLRMNLLLRDYDKIAENINEHSTYVELMAVSELYMNRLVREKDFKGTYLGTLIEETDAYSDVVGAKVKEIYREQKKSLDDEEKEDLELLVDYWKIEAKHPVLTGVRALLEEQAKKGAAGADASKVYLQLAKIAHYYENEKNRSGRLAEAIEAGADSEDDEYSAAMRKIAAIINGDGDINEVMNISDYVRRALENAMPYGMDGFLTSSGDIDLYDNEEEPMTLEESFTKVFEEYVNKTRSAVNISAVDTEEFETVKIRMSVSSDYAVTAEQLRKILKLTDCGFEIEDFTVEKLEYTEGRTHLACDVSGSMDNCIGDLKGAVNAYIVGRNPKENLAISSFASSIKQTLPFGSSNEDLTTFANSFYASGGTSIYWTIMNILENFDSTAYSNNSLILMTDGEDGDYVTDVMIANDLAARAEEKNVKVYTIGLGYVNAEYLTKIAEAGGGVFVHTKESAGLDALYSFLQGQVGNQYIISFQAKDTLTAKNRVVEAVINNGEARCDFTYSLDAAAMGGSSGSTGGNTGTVTPAPSTGSAGTGTIETETEEEEALPVSTIRLLGLSTRELHQNKTGCINSVRAFLPTFEAGMRASIKIYNGDYTRTVMLKYKDSYNAEFIVPRDLVTGTYHVEVTVNGKKGYLSNALVIREIKLPAVVKFGGYEFTADTIRKNSDTQTILSGNVTMNGWLRFKGTLRFDGDLENDDAVTVTDLSGSKVVFDSLRSIGYAKDMAKKNLPFDIPKLGSFRIYDDFEHRYNFEEYETDNIAVQEFFIAKVCCLADIKLCLFPDRLELSFEEVNTKLPFQDMIMGEDKEESFFDVSLDNKKFAITDKSVGIDFSIEVEQNEPVKFLNKSVQMESLNVGINTVQDKYSVGIKFELMEVRKVGGSITLTGVMADEVDIEDASITFPIAFKKFFGPVPVTFNDFTFGLEGGDIVKKFKNKDFGSMTYVGKVSMGTSKLSEFVPALTKYIDDKRILSLPETTLKITPKEFNISGNAKLLFMETIQLAEANVEIGKFKYTNELLGPHYNNLDTYGVRTTLSSGFQWEEDEFEVGITGTIDLNAHTKFLGFQGSADVVAKLDLWVFEPKFEKHADVLVGFSQSTKGKPQFNIILEWEGWLMRKKKWCYINPDEKFEVETEKEWK